MSALFEVGDRVKVSINYLPYAGIVLTYDDTVDPIMYKVSILGLGDTCDFEEADLS